MALIHNGNGKPGDQKGIFTTKIKSLPIPIPEKSTQEDLVYSLKWFLVFGRILGVVPFDGVRKGKVENLKFRYIRTRENIITVYFTTITAIALLMVARRLEKCFTSVIISIFATFIRWKSFGSYASCTCCCFMSINIIIGTIGFFISSGRSANELVVNSHYVIFFFVGLFTYLFVLLKAKEFLRILTDWKYLKLNFALTDKHLWRDTNAIILLIYSSIVLENTTWHVKHLVMARDEMSNGKSNTSDQNMTAGEFFYQKSEPQLSAVIPYHPLTLAFLLITNKFCLYSGHFGDVLLIVLSRAIYYKFKLLIREAKVELYEKGLEHDPRVWKALLEDFSALQNLLSSLESFLSPLVFMSFSHNIYSICLHLNMTLQAEQNMTVIASVYANWSFLHIIFRSYMVSLSAAKINEHALSIRGLLRKCPQEVYSPETARFENQLIHADIGLKGFGCFNVTKPFMLKILSVVFTVEIVLLQSSINNSNS